MACPVSNRDVTAEYISQGVQMCPFLRNVLSPTSLSAAPAAFTGASAAVVGLKGPIFEDGPSFDTAFRLFHGVNGVVPLARVESAALECPSPSRRAAVASLATNSGSDSPEVIEFTASSSIHASLAASAATISLSGFGMDRFTFANFKASRQKKREEEDRKKRQEAAEANSSHEAGSDWLATGKCPIAKTFQALNGAIPLVAKALTPPPGMKYECPPAIVAARAALAKTPAAKALRPKPLPVKILAIGCLGLGLNIPLGMWREHCEKFSPQWVIVVHAAVPFVGMMRKAVLMPKYAMAFTIASCIIGQAIGARTERARLASGSVDGKGGGATLPSLAPAAKKSKRESSASAKKQRNSALPLPSTCAISVEREVAGSMAGQMAVC